VAAGNLATNVVIIMIMIMMMIMLTVYSSLLQDRQRDTKSGTHYSFGEGIHMEGIGTCRIRALFSHTIHFFCTIQHTAYVEPNKQHVSHVESIVPRPVRR